MTFEQQFAAFVVVCIALSALIIYGVHRANRRAEFREIRAALAERGHATAVPTRPRRGARPHDRAAVQGSGGAGRPSVSTPTHPHRARHARAA